ncbi:glycine receptor subunit beta-type 4-like [Lepeophtheirus salmonis]|uniref:glycine receptor subunit beta-type 4-like n=1 Tax=Lepeophtheirus salmonis TaxID=72036 RepID=UPI001AE309E1|nr:glycine receptor subunit beta-type 4-like [Lepeophtheirus salmonis]
MLGNYSCLVAKFHLSRSLGFHMVQSYVPTILIVVISWVSFWMDVDSVPGRTTLGVTTLLTVSSKSAGLNAETPQVSYVKAIDVWMGACTAFIFAALIEFTIINYLWRRTKINYSVSTAFDGFDLQNLEKNEFPQSNGENQSEQTSNIHPPSTVASNRNIIFEKIFLMDDQIKGYTSARIGVKIDESCRILFPLNFLIFNIFYWTYYLYY